MLIDLENKTSSCRDRYRTLIIELKKDIRKIEDEVRIIHNCLNRKKKMTQFSVIMITFGR